MMKRTILGLLAGIVAASFSQNSSAADMALKAAPAIAPVTTWTGLYLGVHGGAAWQSAPNWSAVDPNGVTAPATSPIVPAIPGVPFAPTQTWNNFNVQVARVAVSYKF